MVGATSSEVFNIFLVTVVPETERLLFAIVRILRPAHHTFQWDCAASSISTIITLIRRCFSPLRHRIFAADPALPASAAGRPAAERSRAYSTWRTCRLIDAR